MQINKRLLTLLSLTIVFLLFNTVSYASSKVSIKKVYQDMTEAKFIKPSHLGDKSNANFDIILKPQNEKYLLKDAEDVNTPGSKEFKHFLTPEKFAKKYGQTQSVVRRWTKCLNRHHLHVKNFNNIVLNVSGKVKYVDKTFKMNINKAKYHANPLQFGKQAPDFDKILKQSAWFISGLTEHNPSYKVADTPFTKRADPNFNHPGFTKRFTSHYNVSPLYRLGLTGKGQTIGIIALGTLHKSNAFHFWKHEGASTNPHRLSIERVKSSLNHHRNWISYDEGETTLDTEYAGSVAPQANIKIYWIPDGIFSITNMIDAYLTAFQQNKASSISTSWGLDYGSNYSKLIKKRLVSNHYKRFLNLVLAQGALQGISNFTCSGDTGAAITTLKCSYHGHTLLDENTSSANILGANPWITSTGGTTLPFKSSSPRFGYVDNKKERSWGIDYMWPLLQKHISLLTKRPMIIQELTAGSSGGFSHDYSTPDYQLNVPGVNTFNARNYLSNLGQPVFNQPLLSGRNYGRNYPDISGDADPQTGYYVYQKEKGQKSWESEGGTSFVAPQYAAVAALINSAPNRPRMGFWNPQIYQLAQSSNSPFHPLNSTNNNSNMYYTGQPGTVYNQASGLGTTNFTKLFNEYK